MFLHITLSYFVKLNILLFQNGSHKAHTQNWHAKLTSLEPFWELI